MVQTGNKLTPEIPPGFGAALYIDLEAIAGNYNALCARAEGALVAASVKADAYGLGVCQVAHALASAGCNTFFVATPDEGRELRAVLPDSEICILNGFCSGEGEYFFSNRLTPVLNSPLQVLNWKNEGKANLPCMLHIDTGMNRLGFSPGDVTGLEKNPTQVADLNVTAIISHLACADRPSDPANAAQLAQFNQNLARLGPLVGGEPRASFANSAGIFLGTEYHFDMARAGAALYGLAPQEGGPGSAPNPMRQVVQLFAKILQIRDVDTPMTVGYGAVHKVHGKRRIATISAGYGDGYLRISSRTDEDRAASSGEGLYRSGTAYLGGHPAPMVGRISMDLITLDITDIPAPFCVEGAVVELIGDQMSIDEVAQTASTIGYEILTRLGRRYHRVYLPTQSHTDRNPSP